MSRPKINAAADLPRGKKSQFYAEGYELDVAEDVTAGHATEEQIAHVYGSDDPLTATMVTGGTLSVQVLEKSKNNTFLEVLAGKNPTSDTLMSVDFSELEEISCWFNQKHPLSDRYTQARYWAGWTPAPGDRTNPPNGWSRTTFTGPCDLEKRFDEAPGVGVYIESEKLDLTSSGSGTGYTASLTHTPVTDPQRSINLVRLAILKCASDGTVEEKDEINVDINTCGNGQKTIWVDNDELEDTKSQATHAFAQILRTGSGTLPSNTDHYMHGIHRNV